MLMLNCFIRKYSSFININYNADLTRLFFADIIYGPGIPTCLLDNPNFHLDNLGDPTIAPTIAPTGTYGEEVPPHN